MKRKSGMSLIVLVITIIVMIILAGVVVMGLVENNPIEKAMDAKTLTNLKNIESEMHLYTTKQMSTGDKGLNLYPVERDISGTPVSADSKFDQSFKNTLADELKELIKELQIKYGNDLDTVGETNFKGFYMLDKNKVETLKEYAGDFIFIQSGKDYAVVSINGVRYEGKLNYLIFPMNKELEKSVIENIEDYYSYELLADGTYQVKLSEGFKTALDNEVPMTDSKGNVWNQGDALPNPGSLYKEKKVTSMEDMFAGIKAKKLNFSKFDTRNVTSMEAMFYCNQAQSLDLGSFDTSKVTNMYFMFSGAAASHLNTKSFDTSNVTEFGFAFSYMPNMKTLDLRHIDVSNAESLSYLTLNTPATKIDISTFKTDKVKYIDGWMYNSSGLNVDISKFNMDNVISTVNLLHNCTAPVVDISNLDVKNIVRTNNMFTDCKAGVVYVKNQAVLDKLVSSCGADRNILKIKE